MAIVIPAITLIYARRTGEVQNPSERGYKKVLRLFPLFIFGFLFMAILRSIGDAGIQIGGLAMGLWGEERLIGITKGIQQWSGYILATAMAGVGLGTSFKSMKGLGIKPFYVGLFAATMVGVFAIVMVFVLGRYVTV